VTEKTKSKLGQWAAVLTGLAALVGALVATWATVVAPHLEANTKVNQDQGAKLDGFYGLFKTVIEEQRRQVDSLAADLRELRREIADDKRVRSLRHAMRTTGHAPASVEPAAELKASHEEKPEPALPASLEIFVQKASAPSAPGD